jgi:hypothetical protein
MIQFYRIFAFWRPVSGDQIPADQVRTEGKMNDGGNAEPVSEPGEARAKPPIEYLPIFVYAAVV